MLFASYEFIFAFLPIVLLGRCLLTRFGGETPVKLWLVCASLFFYGWFEPAYLLIIVASIAANYICGSVIAAGGGSRSVALTTGVLFNVLLLGYFKYRDFLAENINALLGTHVTMAGILLPLGISFFTFQQIAYLLSLYRGGGVSDSPRSSQSSLLDHFLFVTFFPQLIAGPIVSGDEMLPQFGSLRRAPGAEAIARGLRLFIVGLFKKTVIADTLAVIAGNGFSAPSLGCAAAWAASLAYTFQIYFDFSGYSDMAIGLGAMFGIRLPLNFDSPYKSACVTEFWRRWHITLGRALASCVYYPLGGSRHGLARTCFALAAVFAVSGLWHGAAWTFVAWGALHGAAVVAERIASSLAGWGGDPAARASRVPRPIRVAGTFLLINALWVLFRADSTAQAVSIWRSMLDFSSFNPLETAALTIDGIVDLPPSLGAAYTALLLSLSAFIVFVPRNAASCADDAALTPASAAAAALMFFASVLHLSRLSVFIYYNF